MVMVDCRRCGARVSDHAARCASCGHRVPRRLPPRTPRRSARIRLIAYLIYVGAMLLMIGILIYGGFLPQFGAVVE